jgi:hypothetical protein
MESAGLARPLSMGADPVNLRRYVYLDHMTALVAFDQAQSSVINKAAQGIPRRPD